MNAFPNVSSLPFKCAECGGRLFRESSSLFCQNNCADPEGWSKRLSEQSEPQPVFAFARPDRYSVRSMTPRDHLALRLYRIAQEDETTPLEWVRKLNMRKENPRCLPDVEYAFQLADVAIEYAREQENEVIRAARQECFDLVRQEYLSREQRPKFDKPDEYNEGVTDCRRAIAALMEAAEAAGPVATPKRRYRRRRVA